MAHPGLHFVLAWEIKHPTGGVELSAIQQDLKNALAGYSWVRPVGFVYIVSVESPGDWEQIRQRLLTVAKGPDRTIHFIMSPLMNGGQYNGWLPKELWPKLLARTGEDVEEEQPAS